MSLPSALGVTAGGAALTGNTAGTAGSGATGEAPGVLQRRPRPQGRGRPVTQVLFIGGWGRSGSTLLDRITGQFDGVVSVGELRDVWQRGLVEDRMCGCGQAFSACPFWQRVGAEAFGGWSALDLDRVLELRTRVDHPRQLPFLLVPALHPGYRRELAEYAGVLSRLYAAIASVGEASVVVDSSKIAVYALVLRHAALRLRVLHLIRDARGVMFSWQKRVVRPDATDRRLVAREAADPDLMLTYGAVSGSLRYLGYNALTQLLPLLRIPYRRLRYEDLVRDPVPGIAAVAALAGVPLPPALAADLDRGQVSSTVTHTVDGNPMRFATGPVKLRLDDAWRSGMEPRPRRLVTLLTAPLLAAYGYLRPAR